MISTLQKVRYGYNPKLPSSLAGSINNIAVEFGSPTESISDREEIKDIFKLTYGKPLVKFTNGKNEKINRKLNVGVILSGGQAPGGHNVIAGLFDGMKKAKLFGVKFMDYFFDFLIIRFSYNHFMRCNKITFCLHKYKFLN